jgi:hypothetical protein
MKERHYIIEDAKRFGILEAIVLYNIRFWISKNKANGKHLYEGKFWTYNSAKAFAELFEEITEHQMKRILSSLKDQGAVIVGNYNKVKFDKTQWYGLGQAIEPDPLGKTKQSIEENTTFDGAILHHGESEKTKPIPDIKTDIKPDDDEYSTPPLKSWKEIKKERGLDLPIKELFEEILQDEIYIERLRMGCSQRNVNIPIPLMKEYLYQVYLALKFDQKIEHKDRKDGYTHVKNIILKDIAGNRALFNDAVKAFKSKQNKGE